MKTYVILYMHGNNKCHIQLFDDIDTKAPVQTFEENIEGAYPEYNRAVLLSAEISQKFRSFLELLADNDILLDIDYIDAKLIIEFFLSEFEVVKDTDLEDFRSQAMDPADWKDSSNNNVDDDFTGAI